MTRRLLFALLLTVCAFALLPVLAVAADGGTKPPATAATPAQTLHDQNDQKDENDDDDEDVVQERHDNEAMKRLPPEQLFQVLKMREARRIATATHDDPPVVAILVPLFFFIALLGLVGGTLWFRFRSERLRQETLRLMIDKGTEIPTALFAPKTRAKDGDMRRGVVLVAVGIGTALFIAIAMQQGHRGRRAHSHRRGLSDSLALAATQRQL
jgi:hypothetical protein